MRSGIAFSIVLVTAFAAVAARTPAYALKQDTGAPLQQPIAESGTLDCTVVVIDDLTPKPVPYSDFTLTMDGPTADARTSQVVRTDDKGHLNVKLAPGKYTLANARPIQFKAKQLVWSTTFTIEAGATKTLQLTDADARATEIATREISSEAKIYQEAKDSVVTVEGDFGHGSGFVISEDGLVLTNQHVVDETQWVALRFHPGLRVRAVVVAQDKDADIAVVRFNPAAIPYKVRPLKLAVAASGVPLATVGEKVIAIGSPLNQENILTSGIVSTVNNDVIISDVNINHGSSGGPLLNMAGEVIGLTTFGDFSAQGGPGISGIVAITKAAPVVTKATSDSTVMVTLPDVKMLPDVSPVPIPNDALVAADIKHDSPVELSTSHHFDAAIFTPLTLVARENRYQEEMTKKHRQRSSKVSGNAGLSNSGSAAAAANPFWARTALHAQDALVMIEIRPSLQETKGSQVAGFLGALGGVQTRKTMEYRDDFYDFALYSGDTLIEPVRRYRQRLDQMFDGYYTQVHDTAYGGLFCYDPSAFDPAKPLTLKMRRAADLSDWMTFKMSDKDQRKIWDQFAEYRASLAAQASK